MRTLKIFTAILIFTLSACDKGLSPPETVPSVIDFPITPQGGNPTGYWIPDSTIPVEVTILDEEKIPSFVDSLFLESNLSGVFSFEVSGSCSVNAVLTINPTVYLQGLPTPLVLSIVDTLQANGPYEVIDNRILCIPMNSSFFNLDTLGFTHQNDNLDLITLPNTFPDDAFSDIRFFFVFKLNRSTEPGQLPFDITNYYTRKKEDRP